VEALVRGQHPARGFVPPGEFLPVLESAGLMGPLSRWVLREAAYQAAS
jgi:EAL domain-containing protein (putative c-di-GMP-specific phosphodiesterase class I)